MRFRFTTREEIVKKVSARLGENWRDLIIQAVDEDISKEVEGIIHGFKNCGHPNMNIPGWVEMFNHSYHGSPAPVFCIQVLAGLEDNLAHGPQVATALFQALHAGEEPTMYP